VSHVNYKKYGKIIGIILAILIVAAVIGFGFAFYDIMGYNAKESQTLNPNGTAVGKALVVYDPGITGAGKTVASSIANELQVNGYKVDLKGISSSNASNTSDYNIIVVGGPIYAGNASSSVKEYLKKLNLTTDTKLGVFATGQDPDSAKNYAILLKEAAPLPENSNLQITALMKVVNGNIDKNTIDNFVNELVK
jgi:menaquinone-dependent protoporphyrinogen IX oxidase